MSSSTIDRTGPTEFAILARLLANEHGKMSPLVAKHLLTLSFSDADKARMHELAVRNQEDALTPAESKELRAFANVGTVLSILKNRARLVLGPKSRHRKSK